MDRRRLLAALAALPLAPARRLAIATTGIHRRPPAAGVEALVLGTAQDAGVPQIDCFADHCARVRAGDAPPPRVACVGLVDHGARQRFLLDATPDIGAQVQMLLTAARTPPPDPIPTAPPPSLRGHTLDLEEHLHGILLTHAHVGHYTGLVQLGKEVAATRSLPVWASGRMGALLEENSPWSLLVRDERIDLRPARPGETIRLTPTLEVTPFEVVHRGELSDTLGYLVHGPERTLMCVPDADRWEGWPVPFDELLARADVALLDGSFWSHDELGHRPQGEVPHPPVSRTLERLAGRPDLPEILFYHLNHTNPLWDPEAPERAALPEGFSVAATGQRIPL